MNESLKLTLCEMQAQLFAQSGGNGYASEVFIKAFMNSDIAEDLDMPFNHMQWAGTKLSHVPHGGKLCRCPSAG